MCKHANNNRRTWGTPSRQQPNRSTCLTARTPAVQATPLAPPCACRTRNTATHTLILCMLAQSIVTTARYAAQTACTVGHEALVEIYRCVLLPPPSAAGPQSRKASPLLLPLSQQHDRIPPRSYTPASAEADQPRYTSRKDRTKQVQYVPMGMAHSVIVPTVLRPDAS